MSDLVGRAESRGDDGLPCAICGVSVAVEVVVANGCGVDVVLPIGDCFFNEVSWDDTTLEIAWTGAECLADTVTVPAGGEVALDGYGQSIWTPGIHDVWFGTADLGHLETTFCVPESTAP